MILVDTSVWINFLNKGDKELSQLLQEGKVITHEFIIGELTCGNLKNRKVFLSLLRQLPRIPTVSFKEVIFFIESNDVYGKGIGFIDYHLLASSILSETKLWTADKKLNDLAKDYFNVSYK